MVWLIDFKGCVYLVVFNKRSLMFCCFWIKLHRKELTTKEKFGKNTTTDSSGHKFVLGVRVKDSEHIDLSRMCK